jgi:hypothetical protein
MRDRRPRSNMHAATIWQESPSPYRRDRVERAGRQLLQVVDARIQRPQLLDDAGEVRQQSLAALSRCEQLLDRAAVTREYLFHDGFGGPIARERRARPPDQQVRRA